LHQEAAEIGKAWAHRPLHSSVTKTTPRIHLRPTFIDPALPVYKEPLQFSQLQSIHTHIRFYGRQLFPAWLEFLNSKDLPINWQETCSSHPKKGGLQWQSQWYGQIGKAKFL